jgi:hypothetical protein
MNMLTLVILALAGKKIGNVYPKLVMLLGVNTELSEILNC